MDARKSAVVAAAKANGVRRVKGQFDWLYSSLGTGKRMAGELAKRASGQEDRPAMDLWDKREVYAIAEYARKLMDRVQNLTGEDWDVKPIQQRLEGIRDRAMRVAGYLNKRGWTAEGFAYSLKEIGDLFERAISDVSLARSNSMNRRH